jgi:hypothetical protein
MARLSLYPPVFFSLADRIIVISEVFIAILVHIPAFRHALAAKFAVFYTPEVIFDAFIENRSHKKPIFI